MPASFHGWVTDRLSSRCAGAECPPPPAQPQEAPCAAGFGRLGESRLESPAAWQLFDGLDDLQLVATGCSGLIRRAQDNIATPFSSRAGDRASCNATTATAHRRENSAPSMWRK